MTKTHKNYAVGRVNSNLVRLKKKDLDLWRNMTSENFSKLWQSGIWDKKCKTPNDKENENYIFDLIIIYPVVISKEPCGFIYYLFILP